MPNCRKHGDLPEERFCRRKTGYLPPVCQECERESARQTRRQNYAKSRGKQDIRTQNNNWWSANADLMAEKRRNDYQTDALVREEAQLRSRVNKDPVIRLQRALGPDMAEKVLDDFPEPSQFFRYIRAGGYIPASEDPTFVRARLSKTRIRDPLPQSFVGLDYLDNLFPHRYKARSGARKSFDECFHDDDELLRIVKYIIGTDRKPTKSLILKNLKFIVGIPSHFFPEAAAALVYRYGPSGDVFDPFLGWGGRTLGAVCAGAKSIVGTDLQPASVDGCRQIISDFVPHLSTRSEFVAGNFAEFMGTTDRVFDLIITSPPFVDTEDYGIKQSKTAEEWVKAVVIPLVVLSKRVLRPDGVIAIHAQDRPKAPVLSPILACFLGASYSLIQEYKYGKRPGQKVLVFKKPS